MAAATILMPWFELRDEASNLLVVCGDCCVRFVHSTLDSPAARKLDTCWLPS